MLTSSLLNAFLSGRLSATQFGHVHHVQLAWLLLQQYPEHEAQTLLCQGIAQLAVTLGVPDKYHHTLSIVFMRLIALRCAQSSGESWETFYQRYPELFTEAHTLIARYYSPERLAQGHSIWVEPDRLALPTAV